MTDEGASASTSIEFNNPSLDLEFKLSICGHQFPDIQSGSDGNWLVAKFDCRYGDERFEKRDPSLETSDLPLIAEWFESISRNQIPNFVCLSFTEPNLGFDLYRNNDGTIRFGIMLSHECKPPFVIREMVLDEKDPDNEFIMVFECSLADMANYAAKFRKLADLYPQRLGS